MTFSCSEQFLRWKLFGFWVGRSCEFIILTAWTLTHLSNSWVRVVNLVSIEEIHARSSWNLYMRCIFDRRFEAWFTLVQRGVSSSDGGRLQFGNEVSQKPVMPISCHEVEKKKDLHAMTTKCFAFSTSCPLDPHWHGGGMRHHEVFDPTGLLSSNVSRLPSCFMLFQFAVWFVCLFLECRWPQTTLVFLWTARDPTSLYRRPAKGITRVTIVVGCGKWLSLLRDVYDYHLLFCSCCFYSSSWHHAAATSIAWARGPLVCTMFMPPLLEISNRHAFSFNKNNFRKCRVSQKISDMFHYTASQVQIRP